MSYPPGGNAGWAELGVVTTDPPVSYPLPRPLIADYYDPAPLNGAGGIRPSVGLTEGASTVIVRGSLEARFTQTEVWGAALLDSISVFAAPCTLTLTVYDDDRTTVLWEVGSDPLHPRPYLMNPDNYGEQEVDMAAGGASIGTVSVEVIDPAQTAGDQDSGWMTARLANLQGKRCILTRFISADLGPQVIIDGPAGNPTLGAGYSSAVFDIRDTRDTERKVKLFEFAGSAATGLRSLVPDELVEGYGYDAGTNTYLIRPGIPLEGHAHRAGGYPSPAVVTLDTGAGEFPNQAHRLLIWSEAYQAIVDGIGRAQGVPFPNIKFLFQWRLASSGDPWTEIPGDALGVSLSTSPGTATDGTRSVDSVVIEDRRLNPLDAMYDATVAALPTEDEIVEFYLLGQVPVSDQHPVVLDSKIVPGVSGPINPTGALDRGIFHLVASIGGTTSGTIDLAAGPGNVEDLRRQTVAVYDRLGNESLTPDIFIPSRGTFSWRQEGSADPFTDIVLAPALPGGSSALLYLDLPLRTTYRVFSMLQVAAPDASMPSDGQFIEFTILYQSGSPELNQVTVGLTAGQLAKNVYDGLYAPRGVDGELVPMRGIYDAAALALMTDPIRYRLTQPVDDARDFLEKMVYGPTGWVPALDRSGRISPKSQIPPTDVTTLPALVNATTEPAPDWDAGQHIVNVVRFTYNREAVFADTDTAAYPDPVTGTPDPTKERQKLVQVQPVMLEFRNEASVNRLGEQILELDGSAFTAIGVVGSGGVAPNPFVVHRFHTLHGNFVVVTGGGRMQIYRGNAMPITSTPVVRPAVNIDPISGEFTDEVGYQLGHARQFYLLPRYSSAAPTVSVNVMRSAIPTLRAGDWVILDLSWFPDFVTARRGLLALGQILSMGDLDCSWRHLLVEIVVPPEPVSG